MNKLKKAAIATGRAFGLLAVGFAAIMTHPFALALAFLKS